MTARTSRLCYGARRVDAGLLDRLRVLAYESGRVIERDGLVVLGFGTAASLELSGGLANPLGLRRAIADLAAIPPIAEGCPAAHGAGGVGYQYLEQVPVALGALRFDRAADAELAVPEVTVVAPGGGEPSVVAVGSPDRVRDLLSGLPETVADAGPGVKTPPPDEFRLASARPHQDFLNRVGAALAEIAAGSLDKLVLAREVTVNANRPLRQADLLGRLRALHPSCTAFAIDGFIGATPELLISRDSDRIASLPLAGTAARSGDPDADRRAEAALLASLKERSEHRVVVDAIVEALSPVVEQLEVPGGPVIVELRNVSHLGTEISGTLSRRDGGYPSALELAGLLHPTPAVAGTPVEVALDYLVKLEELDRDRYAGPVGWVDARGDGEWYLGIRSAIVEGSSARLFAGVGIVADSDPATELAETQLKLQAFLAAAVRP
ncbi:MAG: isochorismate synthase [Acidimicrobiales bacterium]|jgi:menaquinone-specific isochorismate synthase